MRTNYITLHRFCSYKEYEQYMSGSSLHNHTDTTMEAKAAA